MKFKPLIFVLSLLLGLPCWVHQITAADNPLKKVVLIAGKKSHGPVGNGVHDYPWSVKLLKVMLDNSNIAEQVRVEYHLEGWPQDPRTLDDADTIMVISDGRDGDKYEEAPHFQNPQHVAAIQKQIDRGCGFLTFHFSTFAPDKYAAQILDWSGGYFDWEDNGERRWYSAIETQNAAMELSSADHPIARGVKPFTLREEFYYNLRFDPDDASLQSIASVPTLPGREPNGKVVAWARERKNGGRGFGTTCGHFYENWNDPQFRKLILNAIAWSAHVEVPAAGVEAKFYTHAEIDAALASVVGSARAVSDDRPIRALILTGWQYPGHHWQETTPALVQALEHDARLQVDVSRDIEVLATEKINQYDMLVLNYCNWERPGLSDKAKSNFVKYLQDGGGLSIIHFANGAFHFSLPKAGDSDWPEFRKICRRVWNHQGKSGHDSYGPFQVEIADAKHPITQGMVDFRTTDELYFRQEGSEPIEVLVTAHSQVTGNDEPLAFVYEYGQGRVFQTVLGHSADSIRTPAVADLIRRAAAWTAKRPQRAIRPAKESSASKGTINAPQVAARFGQALSGSALVDAKPAYRQAPLTVECWARVDKKTNFNILLANETKASPTHWELFTRPGSGHFTAYMPGMRPDHVESKVDICDGKWHYLAMIFEPQRVRLYVDGKQASDQAVEFQGGKPLAGPLAIGSLVERNLGCEGAVDEVRLSKGIRLIQQIPDAPFMTDQQTIGLWHLDQADENKQYPDQSEWKNHATLSAKLTPVAQPKVVNHFGEEALGFRWTEADSVDNRWNEMEIGPFLASTIPLPDQSPVCKGLSIRLGDQQQATVCYDTATLALRAGWTGDFLRFNPARFGLISSPQIAGKLVFASQQAQGWGQPVQWSGHYSHGDRVVLAYRVNGIEVLESPWVESHENRVAFTRSLQVGPTAAPLTMNVGKFGENAQRLNVDGASIVLTKIGAQAVAVAVTGDPGFQLSTDASGTVILTVGAAAASQTAKLLLWAGDQADIGKFAALVKATRAPESLAKLAQPAKPHWTAEIITRGVRGKEQGAYQMDTLTIPFDNPYRALMFIGDHDFFSNGDLAVCTVHGDVWRVSGVNDSLERLTWRRFATGLFQPLGLKVIDDIVHVLGRDQITQLHDRNEDGEADYYQNFNNQYATSPGGHDYVTCLETDPAGNFYLIHAQQGVLRISPSGQQLDVVATGLRNPNGLAVGPQGTITASPQEGNWTPASCIVEIKQNGYYGYGGPKISAKRPLGYDPPLCWIPRLRDNSSGSQTWVAGNRWGLPAGELLHFSYGKCQMMLAARETVNGLVQGGTVEFPFRFDSGVMRGCFNPHDGQLYVSGLKGWTTAAAQDGCLQRVRYTGATVTMPIAVKTMQNGLELQFSDLLDRETAEDPSNYRLQQWNYKYSANYGSADYRASDSRQEGRDDVLVSSATLLPDGRTLFLEMPSIQPVDQLTIDYTLLSAGGESLRQSIAYTIHALGEERMDPAKLTRRRVQGRLTADEESHLQQGLLFRFAQQDRTDARNARLAALYVPQGEPATPFLKPGPFTVTGSGYLQIALKGEYQFQLEGSGAARLRINGSDILRGENVDLSVVEPVSVSLHQGYNTIEIQYTSPIAGDATFRVGWSGEHFISEPIPPDLLAFDRREADFADAELLRQGRELTATQHCFRCHAPPSGVSADQFAMPEFNRTLPELTELGARLQHGWVAQWLLDPTVLRDQTTMPKLLDAAQAEDRQQAADLVAFLCGEPTGVDRPADADDLITAGEVLYEDLGCIACHRMTEPDQEDEFDRLSLFFVQAKYRPESLKAFLQQPSRHFAGTRMPDFQLSESEATRLAAFVRSASQGEVASLDLPSGSATRGAAAFREIGCANCHATKSNDRDRKIDVGVISAAMSNSGCLAESAANRGSAPKYPFDPAQLAALRAFLQTDGNSLTQRSRAETSQRLVKSYNCQACHGRDGDRSPRGMIILDEGSRGLPPETLPNLTWTGDKLQTAWLQRLFRGDVPYHSRNWLQARMPAFAADAELLAQGLAAEHGHRPISVETTPIRADLVETGQRLSTKGGLDCRQCHGVGDQMPLGDEKTKIAQGINFSHVRERLRHDFYSRFVLDPPRYDVQTKMPKLSADGKTTNIRHIAGGDAEKQFEALWHFIQSSPPVDAAPR
ncbi:ThuA domain-containing protein [Blastopirellula marina]|uniref:Putative large multi-functional protein n=1 Tax=Blastopirellula marina DSM 3645 TaxID=314230 RepID=A3ZY52_9BACT|nr:ThuA domain-containing protein [Blastopirellula marina]EAQ78523.1 putative large multi-functional protein [Blastopirellula marina DSM 3645]